MLETLIAITAILGLSGASARAFTNYLANPGFESGTNSWVIVQPWSWNGPSYAVQNTSQFVGTSTTVHVAVHGGANAFKEWGYFQTYPIASGADPDQVRNARAAVAASLNIFSPEQDEAILRAAGFSGVNLFYAALVWRGWIARD